jgi:pyruvate/2-oxoglutarate dehydrogenase complex dihydrolipoamide acyltransferase (E2) component
VSVPGSRPTTRSAALVVTGLLTALLATGCGQDDDPSVAAPSTAPTSAAAPTTPAASATAGSPTPAATPGTPAVDREITVTVAKRRVTPPTGRVTVTKGQLVRITVTSDVADELHVHGYDLGARLPAGTPGVVEFRADKTGLFEVETHDTELVLFQLVVR